MPTFCSDQVAQRADSFIRSLQHEISNMKKVAEELQLQTPPPNMKVTYDLLKDYVKRVRELLNVIEEGKISFKKDPQAIFKEQIVELEAAWSCKGLVENSLSGKRRAQTGDAVAWAHNRFTCSESDYS